MSVKTRAPYSPADEEAVYLDPRARAVFDPQLNGYVIRPDKSFNVYSSSMLHSQAALQPRDEPEFTIGTDNASEDMDDMDEMVLDDDNDRVGGGGGGAGGAGAGDASLTVSVAKRLEWRCDAPPRVSREVMSAESESMLNPFRHSKRWILYFSLVTSPSAKFGTAVMRRLQPQAMLDDGPPKKQ